MISTDSVTTAAIRRHYDIASPFYWLLWGTHIHHGLWDADGPDSRLSPQAAQVRLTETLAERGRITAGARVLDVGCGLGGSSIHLARTRRCHVTGITLSGVQRRWATASAWWQGVARRVTFLQVDAERCGFPPASFDVVWSIECTEHLHDKAAFFSRAASWVVPGGRVAICAWLAADDAGRPGDAKRRAVDQVCDAFLCPSLGSFADYRGWMEAAGLVVEVADDWTRRVERTWELCEARIRSWNIPGLARRIDPAQALFVEHFTTLLNAYRSGAMHYGCLVASRPPA
jgi:tocopherol O-methyltransferase